MNSKEYRRQWAEGEIEAGTLLDAIDMLSGALEHIAKTCYRSRTSTRRLRWIEQRASWAVEGKPYDRDAFDLPKDAGDTPQKLSLEVCRLKAELAEVRAQTTVALPDGWRVFMSTSSALRDGDRWEVYGPNGGGIVNTHDLRDWAVRSLLDAIASADKTEPHAGGKP